MRVASNRLTGRTANVKFKVNQVDYEQIYGYTVQGFGVDARRCRQLRYRESDVTPLRKTAAYYTSGVYIVRER